MKRKKKKQIQKSFKAISEVKKKSLILKVFIVVLISLLVIGLFVISYLISHLQLNDIHK